METSQVKGAGSSESIPDWVMEIHTDSEELTTPVAPPLSPGLFLNISNLLQISPFINILSLKKYIFQYN